MKLHIGLVETVICVPMNRRDQDTLYKLSPEETTEDTMTLTKDIKTEPMAVWYTYVVVKPREIKIKLVIHLFKFNLELKLVMAMLTRVVNMLKTMAVVFILSTRFFLALVTLPIPPK